MLAATWGICAAAKVSHLSNPNESDSTLMTSSANPPVASVELLIRCTPGSAFSAFVEPATLTRFWLSKASAPLAPGGRARWEFMVPGATAQLSVEAFVPNQRIQIAWDDGTHVEWTFQEHTLGGTVVKVRQWGFQGSRDEVVALALDATAGFTLVLAELKVLLEQGTAANIVRDKAALIAAAQGSCS